MTTCWKCGCEKTQERGGQSFPCDDMYTQVTWFCNECLGQIMGGGKYPKQKKREEKYDG
jgi:hypothetical protein